MKVDEQAEKSNSNPSALSVQFVLIGGAVLTIFASAGYCLSLSGEIEKYAGQHSGRLLLMLVGPALGFLGVLLAVPAMFVGRRSWKLTLLLALCNVVAAVGVVVFAWWPRTSEVMRAVHDRDYEAISFYARLGANLNGRSRWGWYLHCEGDTPLTAAVQNADVRMIRTLLSAGADVNLIDGGGCSPLGRAILIDNREILDLLLDAGADVNHRRDHPLITAAKYKRLRLLKDLLSRGADPKVANPVFLLVEADDEQMRALDVNESDLANAIRELAAAGASLEDEASSFYRTPLTQAIHQRRHLCVRALLESGARIEQPDGHGITPLRAAAQAGDIEVTRILLQAGADVNSNESGRTALAEALMAGELEVAKVLLDAGADIQRNEEAIAAAITGSVLNKRPDILRFVLDHGASARRINFEANRSSPLAKAAGSGQRELVVMLLDAGADPNEVHGEYSTPLLRAIEGGNLEVVELLIARGADVNWVGHWGVTPLKHAERHGRTAIIKYLREQGARPSNSR